MGHSESIPRLRHLHPCVKQEGSLHSRKRLIYTLESEGDFHQIQKQILFKFEQEIQKCSDFYLIDLHALVYKEIPDVEPYRLFIIACTTVIFRQLKFHPKFPGVKFTSHTIGCLKLRRRI